MAQEEDREVVATPHDELCDMALEHYNEISTTAMHSNSLVPKAIEFYKEKWVPRGERTIVYTPGKLLDALKDGWMFDPWLNRHGGPIAVGGPITIGGNFTEDESPVYWILVRGSPEQIEGLEPFVELPSEEPEAEVPTQEPYGLRTDYIPFDKDTGKPMRKPEDGFVVMHKDHVFSKGTVYTLPPGALKPKPWDIAKDIAEISHLGVDEAHDVLTALIKKEAQ